jgi:Domain of unknown function (DUF4861)
MKISYFPLLALLILAPASHAGVVLFNSEHQRITKDQISSKELTYYSWPRGPYIENKYKAWRLLLAAESVGAFDPFSKFKYVSVLPFFDDAKFNKGAKHDFGSDVYHVGDMAGIGSPMFKVGEDWVMLPFYDQTDRTVIELLDESFASPRYRITYTGWKIDPTQKIDVELMVYTSWEKRHIHAEMKVTGFKGEVGAGLQFADELEPVKDAKAATLYHYGKFQKGQEMLQAVYAAPAYFKAFEKDNQGEVVVLKADDSGMVKWSFLHSWSEEPEPLFKEPNWQEKLIYTPTPLPVSVK